VIFKSYTFVEQLNFIIRRLPALARYFSTCAGGSESEIIVGVVFICRPVEPKACLPKGIGRPAACLTYLTYLDTNGPNTSGCRCLTTKGSKAAMASTSQRSK
jgi:hypothetical protein